MSVEPIRLEQSFQIRSRPDVLFRLAVDPKRRIKWDKNLRSFEYIGEEKLQNGSSVRMHFPWRYANLKLEAKFNYVQAPIKATLESTKGSGPITSMTQQWFFKAVPGGTEMRVVIIVIPRFKFGRTLIERMVQNYFGESLLGLQRQVDVQAANMIEEASKEMAEKMRLEKLQAKKKKGKK